MNSLYTTTLRRIVQYRSGTTRLQPTTIIPSHCCQRVQLLPAALTSTQPQQHHQQHAADAARRWMGTSTTKKRWKKSIKGNRGSRGHGWYVKYRSGRGGRHLQGEYWDRSQHHYDLQQWNDAVMSLGSQLIYLDIAVEPPEAAADAAAAAAEVAAAATAKGEEEIDISKQTAEENEDEEEEVDDKDGDDESKAAAEESTEDDDDDDDTSNKSKGKKATLEPEEEPIKIERLIIEVASTVMPETCINFIGLCQEAAYRDSVLYRIEKDVGICGGDVLTNTGKTGQCWQSFPAYAKRPARPRPHPTRRDLPPPSEEPMALWHTAGTVTMLCPKVNEIDSRFLLCSQDAPHLDGIHRAFGKLTSESLSIIQNWQSNIITSNGKPRSATLRIIDCGVWKEDEEKSDQESVEDASDDGVPSAQVAAAAAAQEGEESMDTTTSMRAAGVSSNDSMTTEEEKETNNSSAVDDDSEAKNDEDATVKTAKEQEEEKR